MSAVPEHASSSERIEAMLRAELARCDAMLGSVSPIVAHLVGHNNSTLFSEEIVARTRGMLRDVAIQLLQATTTTAPDEASEPQPDDSAISELAAGLAGDAQLVGHVHALAIEWQLTVACQGRLGLDPILSPLLQALISSTEAEMAASAMTLLAAQGRFVQTQRRMQLPLHELPADQLYSALQVMVDQAGGSQAAREARKAITAKYDEGRSRLGLMARLVFALGAGGTAALTLDHAGVGLFLTALAVATGQNRSLISMTTNETLMARLVLTLAAAGLKPRAIEEQFAAIHPDISLANGVASVGKSLASELLSRSSIGPGAA